MRGFRQNQDTRFLFFFFFPFFCIYFLAFGPADLCFGWTQIDIHNKWMPKVFFHQPNRVTGAKAKHIQKSAPKICFVPKLRPIFLLLNKILKENLTVSAINKNSKFLNQKERYTYAYRIQLHKHIQQIHPDSNTWVNTSKILDKNKRINSLLFDLPTTNEQCCSSKTDIFEYSHWDIEQIFFYATQKQNIISPTGSNTI